MNNVPSYDRLLLLDRLEELREDMDELNVRSIEDLEARIAALEAEIADADVGRVHEPV